MAEAYRSGGGGRYSKVFSDFLGVDLSSAPSNVSELRSPSAPNISPGMDRRPVKRTGWHTLHSFPARINGIHTLPLSSGTKTFIHAGTKLYDGDAQHEVPGAALADGLSCAWAMNDRLWIADGSNFLVCGLFESGGTEGWRVRPVSEIAYSPTITISRDPDGGGAPHEPFNMIGSRFTEEFLGQAYATVYQLSFGALDDAAVEVEVLAPGSTSEHKVWSTLTQGTDFTVDRVLGTVTFTTAPGITPVEGEDNVRITASHTEAEYLARINSCDAGALFGVSGAEDRLFLTGSPHMPHTDWYCQLSDPTYWGESWYSELGGSSRIVGYARLNDRLAAFPAEGGVILRKGVLLNGEAAFPIENVLQGPAAACCHGFGCAGGEPLYLTRQGVFALTSQDVTGDRLTQGRSHFIDGALRKETAEAAYCCVWKDLFLIGCGSRVYLLDCSRKTYIPGAPYSAHQYECYYWENVPARVLCGGETLRFGTAAGKLCEFYTDVSDPASYSDDGEAVSAHWELPDFTGRSFYNSKALIYTAVRLSAAPRTSVRVSAMVRGVWKTLWSEAAMFRYFKWSELSWPDFTWASDSTAKSCGRRRVLPGVTAAVLRFENSVLNEPFGLCEVSLEFIENGRSKT